MVSTSSRAAALSVYDAKGEYQIVCESLEPRGLGALQLAFEQLKRQLAAEGLFEQSRKRPLPLLPRKIGLVTSLDGAAVRDVLSVLDRRYPKAHIVIRPARVQGDGAAPDLARALGRRGPRARRGRRASRARRRIDRGSLGVQRGDGRARDRPLRRAGHFRRRPRDRRDHRRLRGRSPVRRRHRPPPRPSSRAATSSSRGSIAISNGCARRSIAVCWARGRACTRSKAGAGWPRYRPAWRCVGGT